MNKSNFLKTIKTIETLREQINDHVWTVFHRYINIKKINFNSPDDWDVDDNSIYFHGSDGCMGCYDNMSLSIPIEYFHSTDEMFKRLEVDLKKEKKKKEERKKVEKSKRDLREYKRLKEKYEL